MHHLATNGSTAPSSSRLNPHAKPYLHVCKEPRLPLITRNVREQHSSERLVRYEEHFLWKSLTWRLSVKISLPRIPSNRSSLRLILRELVFPEDLIGNKSSLKTYSLIEYALKKTYFKGLEKISLELDLFSSLLRRPILSDSPQSVIHANFLSISVLMSDGMIKPSNDWFHNKLIPALHRLEPCY